ncbi:MAG: hypothetical protein U0414_40545 [Polyangiaceae bacterium]
MTLPWSDEQARWILKRTATLRARGAKPVNGVVLPTHEFFPDQLDRSPKTIARFFGRMLELGGLDFLDVKLELVAEGDDPNAASKGCSSGGCSSPGLRLPQAEFKRLDKRSEGAFTARITEGETQHPTVLAVAMSRLVAAMFLSELDCWSVFGKQEREGAVDLAAVALGFGALIANGSAIEVAGCGGKKVHSATALGAGETSFALALSCALEGTPASRVARYLSAPLASPFDVAARTIAANREVVGRIDSAPASVEDGYFTLNPPAGAFFGRIRSMFSKKDEEDAFVPLPPSTKKPRDPEKEAKLRELRALVDETLGST